MRLGEGGQRVLEGPTGTELGFSRNAFKLLERRRLACHSDQALLSATVTPGYLGCRPRRRSRINQMILNPITEKCPIIMANPN